MQSVLSLRQLENRYDEVKVGLSILFFLGLPGVNFTNILRAAFTHADLKSAKNTVKLPVF